MNDKVYFRLVGPVMAVVLVIALIDRPYAPQIASTGLITVFLARYGIKWSWPDDQPRPSLWRTTASLLAIALLDAGWLKFLG